MMAGYHYYRRERDGAPKLMQTSLQPLDDPELEELTEDEYSAEVASLCAALPQPEPTTETDEATEADLMDALAELGVIG